MTAFTSSAHRLTRRQVLGGVCAGAALGAASNLLAGAAWATPDEAAATLKKLTGGANLASGKIKLTVPAIAENGNTVPISVAVDSPMTDADHVKAIHVVVDGNPAPDMASFAFTPMSGKAEVAFRIRLAQTQNVIAVAQMSNGQFFMAKAECKVTVGGCGG